MFYWFNKRLNNFSIVQISTGIAPASDIGLFILRKIQFFE